MLLAGGNVSISRGGVGGLLALGEVSFAQGGAGLAIACEVEASQSATVGIAIAPKVEIEPGGRAAPLAGACQLTAHAQHPGLGG